MLIRHELKMVSAYGERDGNEEMEEMGWYAAYCSQGCWGIEDSRLNVVLEQFRDHLPTSIHQAVAKEYEGGHGGMAE